MASGGQIRLDETAAAAPPGPTETLAGAPSDPQATVVSVARPWDAPVPPDRHADPQATVVSAARPREEPVPQDRHADPQATVVGVARPWDAHVPPDRHADPQATVVSAARPWDAPAPPDSLSDPQATVVGASRPWDDRAADGSTLAAGERPWHVPDPSDSAGGPPRVGRFVVLRELGRGAMGVVYAAYDEELDRKVALKLVHLEGGADASLGRNQLLREAQALARLTHPHVVAVHEAGIHRGAVFIAMEFVDGVDLQRWLAAAPRSWREVVAVFSQAGAGLRAAHRVGLIHRDFKPSNVLVGDDGRVRVADFGLAARRGHQDAPGHDPKTMDPLLAATARSQRLAATIAGAGALVGTPAYMSPEQFRREPATAASDQFSFCVALYEALHGRRPFHGDSLDALAEQVLRDDPPPPPPGSTAPAWLHAVAVRGLARDPARRFPDMDALLAELARDPEAERRRRRQRALQLAAAVALTLVAVVGGLAVYRAAVAGAHERRAAARLEILRGQLAELRERGQDDEAANLFAAFVELPDNRGTSALAAAYREWAEARRDVAAAIDAHAGAFIAARTRADQIAALRSLALCLARRDAFSEAAATLAALDDRAPELAADPELAALRVSAALDRRDLASARAALDRLDPGDPARTYGHALEHLSHTTSIAVADLGAPPGGPLDLVPGDLDGDGALEIALSAGARGPDVVTILAADPALPELAELRVGERDDGAPTRGRAGELRTFAVPLPPALAGAPHLLVGLGNPTGDERAQVRWRIVPLADPGAPAYVWEDSFGPRPAVADLDGDGAPELYFGSGAYARRFSRLVRDPDGAWQRRGAHARTEATRSDIVALAAGDLDGDGRPELVVSVGPWTAYDVRVLRPDDHGELQLVARKTLGAVTSLAIARTGRGAVIAAAKRDEFANARRFSPEAPFGAPAGLHVLELRGDQLAAREFFPADDLHAVRAADLDADGRDDLLVEDGGDLLLFRGADDRVLAPLRIRDLRPLLALDLDDDPAAEVVVRTADDPDRLLVLGAGDAPLPALPRPPVSARPVPADIGDPALAEAWAHAEELAAIGLPRRSAEELAALARLAGHAREDMLLRAGELSAASSEHAAAADLFLGAAARPDLAPAALTGAIRSRRALGELVAAERLAAERAALPDLAPDARAAADAELAALRRATTDRPQLALRFDRPLDPALRIVDPLAVARDPGTGTLSLRSSTERVVAELPLEWDGGAAALTVDAELAELAWSVELSVTLTHTATDDVWLGFGLASGGTTNAPQLEVNIQTDRHGATRPIVRYLPDGFTGRVRAHFRHDPELGVGVIELDIAGVRERLVLPGPKTMLPAAPAPGPLRLRLTARSLDPRLVGHVRLHAIDLLGVRPGAPLADTPDDPVVRLIAEGELAPALARLGDAPDGVRALWRADLLARLGRIDEAAAAIARLRRDAGDGSPVQDRLVQLLMHDPDALRLAARRALGPELEDLVFALVSASQPTRPAEVRTALAELAEHPSGPAPNDPAARRRHVLALVRRGLAWHHARRLDLATRDLEAARGALEDAAAPELPGRAELRTFVIRRSIDVAIDRRDRAAVRHLLEAVLDDSQAPELSLEIWRAHAATSALLSPDDWQALTRRAAR